MDFAACSTLRCTTFSALFWCATLTAGTHEGTAADAMQYDLRRLMNPTAVELVGEARGAIHIYDSLEINDVDAALDQHFDRIQNMMFIRIRHLPPTGAGPVDVEEDGCD